MDVHFLSDAAVFNSVPNSPLSFLSLVTCCCPALAASHNPIRPFAYNAALP